MRIMNHKWNGTLIATIAALAIVCGTAPSAEQKDQDRYVAPQDRETEARGLSNGLKLKIRLSQNVYQLKTPIMLEASFHNTGKTPVTIVNMVDGSIEGMRYPKYTIHLVTAEGQAAPKIQMLRCGNVNSLFEGDVVEVLPQQIVDPFSPIDEYHFRAPVALEKMYNITRPGRYRIWLEYSYASSDQLRVVKCGYQSDAKLRKNMSSLERIRLERIRRLHVPAPDAPPLEVDRLKSNEVVFEVVS
jgi:hypothetical protein